MGIIIEKYGHIGTTDDLRNALKDVTFFVEYMNDLAEFTEFYFLTDEIDDKICAYTLDQSTVVGLMTRIIKYYKEVVLFFTDRKLELICLMYRTIYESFVVMKYLIKHGEESQRYFRLISYKDRYKDNELLKSTGSKNCEILVEKFEALRLRDRFSISDFEEENNKDKRKRWKLDGKSFWEIQEDVDVKGVYKYVYGMPSDMIHGGWGEIGQFHLDYYQNGLFRPKLEYYDKLEIKPMLSFNSILIEALIQYNEWNGIVECDMEALKVFRRIQKLHIELIEEGTAE